MNLFMFLVLNALNLVLPVASLSITSLPPLRGYFFLEKNHIPLPKDVCMKNFFEIHGNVSCIYFPWNVDDPSYNRTFEQWWSDSIPLNRVEFSSTIYDSSMFSIDDQLYVQSSIQISTLPVLSKAVYRRIGDSVNGMHHFQWRFDPFYKLGDLRNIIVRYKRHVTVSFFKNSVHPSCVFLFQCEQPFIVGLSAPQESMIIESCDASFKVNRDNYFPEKVKTPEEVPLPQIPPITERDFEPIKNDVSLSTDSPSIIESSITPTPHDIPVTSTEGGSHFSASSSAPVANSQVGLPLDTTLIWFVSFFIFVKFCLENGMITISYCFFQISFFLITVSHCFRALVILCGFLLVIILIFASIMLYQFYHLKPVKVVENVYVPASEPKAASKKSSKPKKPESESDALRPNKKKSTQSPSQPKHKKRKLDEEAKVGMV